MKMDGRIVQVVKPIPEHSLAHGVVGTATQVGLLFPDLYALDPVIPEDEDKFKGLLFTEAELEPVL